MLSHDQVQLQLRHVFQTIATIECRRDRIGRMPAAAVAQLGQRQRIAFAGDEGAKDLQAGDAGDVAQDLG